MIVRKRAGPTDHRLAPASQSEAPAVMRAARQRPVAVSPPAVRQGIASPPCLTGFPLDALGVEGRAAQCLSGRVLAPSIISPRFNVKSEPANVEVVESSKRPMMSTTPSDT